MAVIARLHKPRNEAGMTALHRLGRTTLTDRAAESLARFIETGDLSPGDVMPSEASLADQLGVSRPVVREALRTLEGRGVVQIVNGRGAVVQALDAGPLRNYFQHALRANHAGPAALMEARAGIEVQSARLAAQRRTPADLERMQSLLDTARGQIDDLAALVDTDLAFHSAIAQASGNALIGYLVGAMRDALREVIRSGLERRGDREAIAGVLARHEPILAAIGVGDAEAAGRAMDRHFSQALDFIRQ